MTTTSCGTCTAPPDHPAKFSRKLIERLREMLAVERERVGELRVLDPFAGAGGVHELAEERITTIGVELQPEWAAAHPDTICGDVLDLPEIMGWERADVLVTSPCYGNRMADSHEAKDKCRVCDGAGCEEGCGTCTHAYDGPAAHKVCVKCKGTGLTIRNTYTHKLRAAGAEPVRSDTNAQLMQWGAPYRVFHEKAWRACDAVLRPGALVLLNVKNHVRTVGGVEVVQAVVEFHVNTWLRFGYLIEEMRRVETRGLAYGANADVRTPAELIVALRKPENGGML